MNVFVMCALASASSSSAAGTCRASRSADHASNGLLAFAGTALYLGKSWLLVGFVMTKRVSLPRVRSNVLLGLALRYGLPIAVVAVGLTVLQALYPPVPTVATILSGITLATGGAVLVLFLRSVGRGERARSDRSPVSAIL